MRARRKAPPPVQEELFALAEGLYVPLLTVDGPLSRARGHQAQIELLQ